MAEFNDTVGMKLRALKERAGMSLGTIAAALDRKRSAVQYYFEPAYRPNGYLDLEDAITFASVFEGKGSPPITQDDVFNLTALPKADLPGGQQVPDLEEPVARVIARSLAMVALRGQEPANDVVSTLAQMLQELHALQQREPAVLADVNQTSGALRLLGAQLSRPKP